MKRNLRRHLKRNLKRNPSTAMGTLAVVILAALSTAPISTAQAGGRSSFPSADPTLTGARVIVKLKSGADGAAAADQLEQSLGAGAQLTWLRTLGTGAQLYRLATAGGARGMDAAIAALARNPAVAYAEPDRVLVAQAVPNDTLYADQWHYYETAGGLNLPPAWDVTVGSGAVAAVLDTGYRPHADLVANILPGYDFIIDTDVANDGDGRDPDATDPGDWTCFNFRCTLIFPSSWHGTHVSGTVAAVTNNASGVAGVAYGAKVVPARVLGTGGGFTSDIADAIIWASGGTVSGVPANAHPADVINMSLGGGGACDNTSQTAINIARANGTSVVVSAGNSDTDTSGQSPASCDGVINVAASNRAGARASYSNYGALVDVAAPGGETSVPENGVLSTLNDGQQDPGNDSYAYYQGTSMAAPHVTGAVALMRSVNASLTPDQIECVLKATARPFPATPDQPIGSGIVDAHAAVVAAQGGAVLTACGGSGGGGGSDTTPNAFAFVDVTDVAASTTQTSNAVTITGIDAPSPISVSGGLYSIGCTASFTSAAGSISNNQTVCVRHTSSASPETTVNTTLTVGGVSDTFSSTTAAGGGEDTTPDAFHFNDVTKAKPRTTYTSNAITVTGTNAPAPISLATTPSGTNMAYSINGGPFTAAAGSVGPGDSVQLRVTYPGNFFFKPTEVRATVNIGGVTDEWRLTVLTN